MKLSDHIFDPERVTNQPRDLRRLRESNAVYRQRSNRVGAALLLIILAFATGLIAGGAFVLRVQEGAREVGR